MAIETGKISYGGDMMLFVGTSETELPIAFSTNAKLDITLETRTIASKDSGYWTEKAGGRLDWNATTDALHSEVLTVTTGTNTFDELFTLMTARTPIDVVFAAKTGTAPAWTVDATKKNFTGKAIITSLSLNAPDADTATYSISLEGTGALVMA